MMGPMTNPFQGKQNADEPLPVDVNLSLPTICLTCPICLCLYNLEERAPVYWITANPKCYHTYCILCVTTWISTTKYQCPLCTVEDSESPDVNLASIQYNSVLMMILKQVSGNQITLVDREELKNKFETVQKVLAELKRERNHDRLEDRPEQRIPPQTEGKIQSIFPSDQCDSSAKDQFSDEYPIARILTLRPKQRNPKFFMWFANKNKSFGRIILETRPDLAPKMAKNFNTFCSSLEPSFCYRNSHIFQVCPGEMIRGGDVQLNSGQGGYSIYDRKKFPADESPLEPRAGAVVMARWATDAKTKLDLVGSQFLIRLNVCGSDRGRILGYVISGLEVVDAISHMGGSSKVGPPLSTVFVSDCGRYDEK